MVTRGTLTSFGPLSNSLVVFLAVTTESLDDVYVTFVSAGEETSLSAQLHVNSKVFVFLGVRCPMEQLEQVVAIRDQVKRRKVDIRLHVLDRGKYRYKGR